MTTEELFPDDMTLGEARLLLVKLAEKGVECPACFQFAKIYRRPVNSSMARGLIATYRAFGREFGYLQDVRRANGETDNREESKLRYWGLLEEEPTRRPDGGRAGWWRVTQHGEQWIRGEVVIPKYAEIYNGECLGLIGEPTTIRQALGKKFDLAELMDS